MIYDTLKGTLKRVPPFSSHRVQHVTRYYLIAPLRRAGRVISGNDQPPPRRQLERYQVPGCETFFGYFDLSPLHADCRRLLAHAVPGPSLSANGHGEATVGYFVRGEGDRFVELGRTTSWCSQMGARLRWYPGAEANQVAFNLRIDGRHVTRIVDADTRDIIEQTPMALFDISTDGRYGLSLDFAGLARLRPGYGYADGAGDAS